MISDNFAFLFGMLLFVLEAGTQPTKQRKANIIKALIINHIKIIKAASNCICFDILSYFVTPMLHLSKKHFLYLQTLISKKKYRKLKSFSYGKK